MFHICRFWRTCEGYDEKMSRCGVNQPNKSYVNGCKLAHGFVEGMRQAKQFKVRRFRYVPDL